MKQLIRPLLAKRALCFIVAVLCHGIFARGARADLVPAPLLKWSEKGPDYAVLVDKSVQKVYLYHKKDPFKPLKIYPCSTGENSGPKTRKNDRKTPEGVYFFVRSYEQRELAPIYGVKAFPIDYPNPFDRKVGNGGYGIWFHGTNKPLKPRDTNGCIVLENESIKDLARYIALNDTPAIISAAIRRVPDRVLRSNAAKLEEVIDEWRKAWQSKDIERYMSFYAERFRAQGMDRERWKRYKARLARKYKNIRVTITGLQLFQTNGLTLAQFQQTYRTEVFESRGRKRLYMAKERGRYKIVGEVFEGAEKFLRKAQVPSPKEVLAEIRRLVEGWRAAWETKDLASYISYYAPEFRSGRIALSGWRRYKARLNRKYHIIKIHTSDLKVVRQSGRTAVERFRQDYRVDTYRDVGIKELYLVRLGRDWKIKREIWRPIAGDQNL